MFVIRDDQKKALDEDHRKLYVDRTLAHLARFFPDDYARAGEPAVRELVTSGMERAKAYGLEREADITGFISLMLVIGKDFDGEAENAWMRQILACEMVDPDAKIKMILEDLPTRWEAAGDEDEDEDEDDDATAVEGGEPSTLS